jgi:glycosyltransferase involved in cell wall biosynthesis
VKIAFLTENFHCGGLDTVLTSLVNNWPHAEDELTIVCNQSHPGCEIIQSNLSRPCRIIRHTLRLYPDVVLKTKASLFLRSGRRLLSPVWKYLFFFYYVVALRSVLRQCDADRLMVVNGGHPGGDSCRAAVVAWALFEKSKPRAIYNFHNLAVTPRWFEKWQEALIDRLLAKSSGALIGVSRACAKAMDIRPALARSGRVSYIYNGISAVPGEQAGSNVRIRTELGIPDGSPVCMMLATYEPRKGHAFLLHAFQRVARELPDAHLVVCGYGYPEEIARVRDEVERLGLSRCVHLLGFRNDAAELLRNANVLLVASQEFESFGLTSVEAMAHRVPVVATRVGGIPEVVEDGDGGVCVAPDDVEGYARNIVRFLRDREDARSQGEKGYQRYRRMFTADRMAREYAQIVRRS